MPISINTKGEPFRMISEAFSKEDELQSTLERCPYLLIDERDPEVYCVCREANLRSAGYLDLLLIDAEATPIAVEVKLARNGQARREVVAQAFDYVSEMSLLTYDELDDLVGGNLTNTIREFVPEEQFEEFRKQCGQKLRLGNVGVVIAVDEANPELQRIIRYVNDQSKLDLRLIEISKYHNGEVFVPRILVAGNKEVTKPSVLRQSQNPDENFIKIIEEYDQVASKKFKTRGRSNNYRLIRKDSWPGAIHYEFLNSKNEIGVEVHLESNAVKPLSTLLKSYVGQNLNGQTIEWDPKWSSGRGRLYVKFPKDIPSSNIVEAMVSLVELTADSIDSEVERLSS